MASASPRNRSRDGPETVHSSGASAARKTWRRSSISSVASCWGPQPPASSALSATSTELTSPPARASSTAASSGRAASADPDATTWSSAESASRAEPRPRRTAASSASSSTWSPASSLTDSRRSCSVSAPRSRNSRCWVRLRMVGGTFWGSVVARTNTTWLGGSSSVFNNALAAAVESMWTSSTMYTFQRPGVPSPAWATRSRMASTPLFEAASSSCTLRELPWVISRTRGADAAWLAVDRRLAVERLGQYPCRGRLARAPRAAEQIGMRHAVVADGAAKRPHHMVLTSELVESPRPEAPIQGDEGCVGHGGRAYPCARTSPPAARCGGQVGYGTRPYPLRAAAFRP